jgi:hypothetical protein
MANFISKFLVELYSKILAYIKYKKQRWYWSDSRQLYWIKSTIQDDLRWLAHDPIARTLCERYLSMLVEEWEHVSVPHVSQLRQELGITPKRQAYEQPEWKSQIPQCASDEEY